MPVTNTSITTTFQRKGTNSDVGSRGYVLKDYLIDVYPSLVPGVKTPGLWVWGLNSYGQLGDNTTANRSSPTQNAAPSNWRQVTTAKLGTTAGFTRSGGIKTDGTLWLWGYNYGGTALGISTTSNVSSPVQVAIGGTNWVQIVMNRSTNYALKADGSLWTWDNSNSSPVQVFAGDLNWRYVAINDGFPSALHSAGIRTDGTLWLWGSNSAGQLGDNTTTSRASPVQTVMGGTWLKVQCGGTYTAAIRSDGTLWVWGSNAYGQLGDNTVVSKSSPVQIIASSTTWSDISTHRLTTIAVSSDGRLWNWGNNAYFNLGDNTSTKRSSPVQTVAGGTNWKAVSNSYWSTAGLKTDGSLWTWGYGIYGALGNNSAANRASPVQVTIGSGRTWKSVVVGSACMVALADGNY